MKNVLFGKGLLVLILSAVGCTMSAQPREKTALQQWQFCEDKTPEGAEPVFPAEVQWESVALPHGFRLSGLNEHASGWYRCTLDLPKEDAGRRYYLYLEGAASVADVWVNRTWVGRHRGGFTAAAFDLTDGLKFGQSNELLLRVNNRLAEAANCLSHSNLYYTDGGLYRPAWLVQTGSVHIYPDMGSCGVYLTPKNITDQKAVLQIQTVLRNTLDKPVKVQVRHQILDPDGKPCGQIETAADLPAQSIQKADAQTEIPSPRRWDIRQPNLYTVRTEVVLDGQTIDAVTERTGIRTIEFKDGRFLLNGKELLVRGVCKHHQDEHTWNAMTDEQLRWEWQAMMDLGVNTVRLAHYPHRRLEYQLADEYGVAIWAENGLAGQKWDRGVKYETAPNADGERITREMVRQNWNHPSILFWSSGNETYQEVASYYADIIRQEDTTRLITYASAGEKPANVDFVAGNTYQGWYGGHYMDFAKMPDNAYTSETGAGMWLTHHVPYGTIRWDVDKFEPEEYGELFAEFRFQDLFRNNPEGHKMFLWWNFREFYNKKFKNNRNTKGIITLAGMPKDFYYHFQSFLKPDQPVLHLCGRHHFYRQFEPDNGIKVYSNAEQVELFLNGVSQGVRKNGEYRHPDSVKREGNNTIPVKGIAVNNVFFWKSPLAPGKNVIEARDNRGLRTSMVIYQKAPDGQQWPEQPDAPVTSLTSSNPDNPAIFIDRPIESQGPFYYEVNGQSDNTFDELPEPVRGAKWIATKRLSRENNRTDLSFRVNRPAEVFVMYSTGTFPKHTLKKPDEKAMSAAAQLEKVLKGAGFADTGIRGIWRAHDLWLADCALMRRTVQAGQTVTIPGQTLDYVVLIKER
ncbi:MAG TPA: glycoside hydrolase family 2 TIM barrel-domain containing protein [Anaerohalosphaeraceae bacterium]|nr:glycoside hydrolase family 2 TIM barrel-domain containing protein [Anaerohalosphaeraceae bacterium]